eukprot:TRINITY_DN101211_c0_g1_i1.p1 TRINITY_DN101211_c0_g1~~TRINITY_DN101211_c0_g1_i1.p1  ORF type:complete len:748 (+),score=178.39 TRINITY_DN101211_c0_g1_i1:125-2368(+)
MMLTTMPLLLALLFQAVIFAACGKVLGRSDRRKLMRANVEAERRRPLDVRQIEECKEVNHKASLLLANDLQVRMDKGLEVSDEEKELLTRLTVGSFSEATLKDLEDLMANVTLASAIQKGIFWTLEDQQEFARCNADTPVARLEENVETAWRGYRLVQGDMVALEISPPPPAEQNAEGGSSLLEQGLAGSGASPWLGGAVVYCFQTGITDRAQTAFLQATQHVTEQVPCINFTQVPANSNPEQGCAVHPSVMVTSSEPGCWSFVGQVRHLGLNMSQRLNLGLGCEIMGIAAHQLGHTLGLVHQTSRADRDRFLSVLEWNVDSSTESNYAVNFAANDEAYANTVWDIMSLMNLSPFAFSSNGHPTFLVKHDARLTELVGQRMGFSQTDVEHLAEMYECYRSSVPKTANKRLAQAFLEGKGYDDGMCQDERYTGMSLQGTVANCSQLADVGLCSEPQHAASIQAMCPVSCMVCLPGLIEIKRPRPQANASANATANSTNVSIVNLSQGADGLLALEIDQDADSSNDTWHGGKHNRGEEEWLLPWSASGKGAGGGKGSSTSSRGAGGGKGGGDANKQGVKPGVTEAVAETEYACQDSPKTGIKIRDGTGKYASCSKLRHYCNHSVIGERVTAACKRTCGQCEIQPVWSADCKDKGALEEPLYELSGVYASCANLQIFCSWDERIRHKCKASCGQCPVQLDLSEVPVQPTPAPTQDLYPPIPVNATELAQETGCSRRRSFGYCYTRRRRAA